jgi:hypothetical protein
MSSLRKQSVGWAKARQRRAHHRSTASPLTVGALPPSLAETVGECSRFAHPTNCPTFVIASEAKQSRNSSANAQSGLLRRFAPRNDARNGVPAALMRPSHDWKPPSKSRGRRECRVFGCTRSLVCNENKHTSIVATGEPKHRHSLRNGVNGCSALSSALGLSGHRRRRAVSSAGLIPASRDQDHAAWPSALAPLVLRRSRVHRIPPRVRDDAQRPSHRGGMARHSHDLRFS